MRSFSASFSWKERKKERKKEKKKEKEPVFSQLSTPFRSSDISDPGVQIVGTAQRDACEKKKLPWRRTPLSQRLEQARL